MERLTIPDEKIEGGVRRTVIDSREVKKNAMTIYWALKKYEDTGLDPDQIQGLKDRDTAKPLMERHYEEPGEEPYIKYTCPNGCNIQPSRRSQFCSLCGQRLDWSGENDAVQ